MATVALFLHQQRDEAAELAAEAIDWLSSRDHTVRLPPVDAELSGHAELGMPEDVIAEGVDFAVSLGGDGTMLRTVAVMGCAGVPVLGVNVGQLGYLTEVEPAELFAALGKVLAGEHVVEERMLLDVFVEGGPHTLALNEMVIEKTPTGHTVRLSVAIDDEFFTTYAADGLIVATPTGSTAYSFSARGPIGDPAHRAMVITPVSPHMLFDRSMVLAPEASIRLEVTGFRQATVSADGRRLGVLDEGQGVVCTAASEPARLIRFGGSNFHRILKQKFGLNDR
jgi:NAD+ kinase